MCVKKVLTNIVSVVIFVIAYCGVSFYIAWALRDADVFAASGAIMTIGGVLLAARKLVRLGYRDFLKDARTIDLGSIEPTEEEIKKEAEEELDFKAYKTSIVLLVIGTLIWAYGGFIDF